MDEQRKSLEFLRGLFKEKSRSPKSADDHFEVGKSEALFGNYREALSHFNKALAINPSHVNSLLERGKAKVEMKEYKAALPDYNLVIALLPKNATAYQKRAKAKDFLKDYEGALKDLDIAVKLQPDFAIAFYERGLIKMMVLRDKAGAQADLSKAGELGFAAGYQAMKEFYKADEK